MTPFTRLAAMRADEPGSGRVSQARSRAPSDALCAHTIGSPRWPLALLASAAIAAVVAMAQPTRAQQTGSENAVLAVPNVALTFAPGYLAEDWGLFAKHGLNVKSVVIAGIGSA